MQSDKAISSERVRALTYLSTGVALFAIMDGLGKYLATDHSVGQVVWARYAFALPVLALVAGRPTWRAAARDTKAGWQILRALLPLVASVFVVLGVTRMPLGDFTAISYASPLLVAALSWPILGEKTRAATWIGVLVGFIGVMVIARPGTGALAVAAIFPLGTAFCFALYQVMTRLLSRGGDSAVTFVWTIGVGFVIASLMVPFDWRPVSAVTWIVLAASGLLFGLAHLLIIRAYALAPASFLAPFTYVQIVAAAIMGFVTFGDIPDLGTMIGTAIVVGSGVYVLSSQGRAGVSPVALPRKGA